MKDLPESHLSSKACLVPSLNASLCLNSVSSNLGKHARRSTRLRCTRLACNRLLHFAQCCEAQGCDEGARLDGRQKDVTGTLAAIDTVAMPRARLRDAAARCDCGKGYECHANARC
eukprot:6421411-Amphidinium_carterae.1